MDTTGLRILPGLYCLWATLAIGLSVVARGLSAENVTRLLVVACILVQVICRDRLTRVLSWLSPRWRFIVLGTLLAAVVEGFHMISRPVFLSLRIGEGTSFAQGLGAYALDLLFTVPAYLVIFRVIWHFVEAYDYTFWQYVLVMGLAQTLGDGGIFFFLAAPPMLLFLPYPMTNYHACNVIPFLAVRDGLPSDRPSSPRAYLALPAVLGTYLVCGAVIKVLGRAWGLE